MPPHQHRRVSPARGGADRRAAAEAMAGLWEPYDGRLSRTVLREPGGEIPPGYSPNPAAAAPPAATAAARHVRLLAAVDPEAQRAAGGKGDGHATPK